MTKYYGMAIAPSSGLFLWLKYAFYIPIESCFIHLMGVRSVWFIPWVGYAEKPGLWSKLILKH